MTPQEISERLAAATDATAENQLEDITLNLWRDGQRWRAATYFRMAAVAYRESAGHLRRAGNVSAADYRYTMANEWSAWADTLEENP